MCASDFMFGKLDKWLPNKHKHKKDIRRTKEGKCSILYSILVAKMGKEHGVILSSCDLTSIYFYLSSSVG